MLDTTHPSLPTDQTDQAEWLAGELLLFGLLGKLLYTLPDPGWYRSLVSEDVFAELPLAADQAELAAGWQRLQTWRAAVGRSLSDEAFEALRADYYRLFVGPGSVAAPLWESVYFSDERLLFQQQTSQVRHWYESFGLQSTSASREPEDHLGLELDFLAHLAAQGLQALDDGQPAALDETLAAQRQFLHQHPLCWVPAWRSLVEQEARTDFWQAVAQLADGALLAMAAYLGAQSPAAAPAA